MVRQSSIASGAKFTWTNRLSNGATWDEDFELALNDAEISGADTSTWKLTLKRCGSIVLTLTSGSEITVTQNTTSTIFAIDCAQSSVDSLCGDYDCDFAEQTAGGKIVHWCSGTVTFVEEDLGF